MIADRFSVSNRLIDQARLAEKSVREEEELANRSLDEDRRTFQDITNEIKEKLLEILSIKTENKELVSRDDYRLVCHQNLATG